MIVTRQRRRRGSAGRLVLPLVSLAALGFALGWPPSQRAIAGGPLKPVWGTLASAATTVGRPLSFAAEQEKINDRDRTIRRLNGELEKQREAKLDADTRAQQLQQEITTLSEAPQQSPAPAVRHAAGAAFAGATASPGDGVSAPKPPSAHEKRLAATWAAMEPEKAAAIVQRLPDDEVKRIFAAMDTDSAGAIMNVLPATLAARISRSATQAAATWNR